MRKKLIFIIVVIVIVVVVGGITISNYLNNLGDINRNMG